MNNTAGVEFTEDDIAKIKSLDNQIYTLSNEEQTLQRRLTHISTMTYKLENERHDFICELARKFDVGSADVAQKFRNIENIERKQRMREWQKQQDSTISK